MESFGDNEFEKGQLAASQALDDTGLPNTLVFGLDWLPEFMD